MIGYTFVGGGFGGRGDGDWGLGTISPFPCFPPFLMGFNSKEKYFASRISSLREANRNVRKLVTIVAIILVNNCLWTYHQ